MMCNFLPRNGEFFIWVVFERYFKDYWTESSWPWTRVTHTRNTGKKLDRMIFAFIIMKSNSLDDWDFILFEDSSSTTIAMNVYINSYIYFRKSPRVSILVPVDHFHYQPSWVCFCLGDWGLMLWQARTDIPKWLCLYWKLFSDTNWSCFCMYKSITLWWNHVETTKLLKNNNLV